MLVERFVTVLHQSISEPINAMVGFETWIGNLKNIRMESEQFHKIILNLNLAYFLLIHSF